MMSERLIMVCLDPVRNKTELHRGLISKVDHGKTGNDQRLLQVPLNTGWSEEFNQRLTATVPTFLGDFSRHPDTHGPLLLKSCGTPGDTKQTLLSWWSNYVGTAVVHSFSQLLSAPLPENLLVKMGVCSPECAQAIPWGALPAMLSW